MVAVILRSSKCRGDRTGAEEDFGPFPAGARAATMARMPREVPRVWTRGGGCAQHGEYEMTSLAASTVWDLEPVLEVWIHPENRPPLVTLTGRLDGSTGVPVRDLLTQLFEDRRAEVVVDLTGVQIADQTGIALLASYPDLDRESDRTVKLLPNDAIRPLH